MKATIYSAPWILRNKVNSVKTRNNSNHGGILHMLLLLRTNLSE